MSVRAEATAAARDAVPFLVITAVWIAVSLVLYGGFLVTKPPVEYPAWAYAAVFVPGMLGYAGHLLRQALSVLTE